MQQSLNKRFLRIDDSFRKEDAASYDLLLELATGFSSFALIDREKNILSGIGSFKNPVFSVLEEFPWLRSHFNSTRISILNNRYTLIPEPLFIPGEKHLYTSFLLDPQKEKEEIRYSHIEHAGIFNVFALPERFPERLNTVLPEAKLFHISEVLIRALLVDYSKSLSERMFLNVRDEAFDLLIFDEKQLIYCNSFYFHTPEDLVYYLIFVMEQLELEPEVIPLYLMGDITADMPLHEMIMRYVRNVDFIQLSGNVNLSRVFDDFLSHKFYSLINLGVCGS